MDYKLAMEWYKKAVDGGSAAAMNNIGWMYQNGKGVTKSVKLAIEWYEKAVDAGSEEARDNLEDLEKEREQ